MSQSIDATLFASKHPNITKRTSTFGLIVSSLLILIGLIALISANRLEEYGTVVTMILMLSGTILIISGIFQYFWKGKEVVYTPTGSIAKQ